MGKSVVRQIIVQPRSREIESGFIKDGFNVCGFCRVCTCLKWSFLSTSVGIVKSLEVVLSGICLLLLSNYGMKYANDLGFAFHLMLAAASASCFASLSLLACYLVSPKTLAQVRPTLFEIVHNAILSGCYISSGCTLTVSVHRSLFYYYNTVPGFNAYPAMTATYILGFMVGILHGIDAFLAIKDWRLTRSQF